jgi:hypothetical protein
VEPLRGWLGGWLDAVPASRALGRDGVSIRARRRRDRRAPGSSRSQMPSTS